ncbi:3-oxoacid CoA-transferase subunit A [Sphingomonas sp.]|uniref:3-oxoacid CoA-transferase subunit A n=1 Tax=Sphingomonas sp. TaxID=28214 RepID=UPI000DB47D38|nr:3-oxoacid CoA-transferase subunit A [Sphingomonas sp.]PZU06481.1 MAG: 3-oxoadipate CoA-transferase [Sphingomonas sp.]
MPDKTVASLVDALAGVRDGATVLVGGFGSVGHPTALLDALIEQGASDLTLVSNNSGFGDRGMPRLMQLGRVRKIICSFPRTSEIFSDLYKQGKIEVEVVPQGTLAERMRAAGAGIPAFYTRTGANTLLAEGKESREFDGHTYIMERWLPGDVALVEAWRGDRWGNLTYNKTGRNFNPDMATAATLTIAQVDRIVPLGELDPDQITTQGIFVDRVVEVRSPAG